MNEHIVGTALYYLDSDNVTPSFLSFRMQMVDESGCQLQGRYEQDRYHYYERIFGIYLGGGASQDCIQNYGSIETREGRLLAFPNTL